MRHILLTLLLLSCLHALAGVQSETVFFLQPDGRHYLLERSIHSDSPTHRFHVNKNVQLEDIRHISPARFEWDEQSDDQVNSLQFEAGGFTLIYPGSFAEDELKQDAQGDYHYRSWDGTRNHQGLYGYWYSPGQFDQFTYTWIVPDNIELLRYRSNQRGTWTRRPNAVSFYAEQVNNLTFEISCRVSPTSPPPPPDPEPTAAPAAATRVAASSPGDGAAGKPPPLQPGTPVRRTNNGRGRNADSDRDGTPDPDDLCPDTPAGSKVDQVGCPLDSDHDGIPDGVDRCLATAEETPVDTHGCELDPARP